MSALQLPVVVLDVDRTLVAGTSWFHVLADPLGPLGAAGASAFVEANEQARGPSPSLAEPRFRARTLELLGRAGITAQGLREAGRDTVYLLPAYVEPLAYLRLLAAREPSTEVVFLSSGFGEFITGVVEGVLRAHQVGPLRYRVVGSELAWGAAGPQEVRHVDGAAKAAVVGGLISEGRQVRLVADDQYHDEALFAVVEAAGGAAVRVVHASPMSRASASWREQLRSVEPDAAVLADVMDAPEAYGLDDTHALLSRHRAWFTNLPYSSSPIGVGEMTLQQYEDALRGLTDRPTASSGAPGGTPSRSRSQERLRECLDALTHVAGPVRLLRGVLYQLAAPPYLFADARTRFERWRDCVDVGLEALALLDDGDTRSPEGWATLPREERWLVLTVLDHLRSAVLHGVDAVIRLGSACAQDDALALDDLQRDVDLAYWSLVTDQPMRVPLVGARGWQVASDVLSTATTWRVRELDDPYVCLLAALSMRTQLAERGVVPTCIVDFASGALDFGGALAVITPPGLPAWPRTRLAHVAYSSKGRTRRGSAHPGRAEILAGMHPVHRARLHDALAEDGTVLLVDNNVATFATLAASKALLEPMTPGRVEAAVACVFVENITDALCGRGHEPLVDGWEHVLDLRPAAAYVTAFATWGTSCKTVELDRLYRAVVDAPELPAATGNAGVLKICRVQNTTDAAVSLRGGANWFGVHAVSPTGGAYTAQQRRYDPPVLRQPTSQLPLPWHELDGIRNMITRLDGTVEVVVVVEDLHPPEQVAEILSALGVVRPCRLQLQCRVTSGYLATVRPLVRGFVCAVGVDQHDAGRYVDDLAPFLDPDADLFLLDHSAHQPDLISGASRGARSDRDIVLALAGAGVGVLVADDCRPADLVQRAVDLHDRGVPVVGVDTQNAVEVTKCEQRFRAVAGAHGAVDVLIRKSADTMNQWRDLVPTMERTWGRDASLYR